ncbi:MULTISPECIES: DUF2797 domain-containing protein [unclassified Rhodococcus (in: high G+C Gram-positive bacteria)]|uniref:DUF2797 domain-containing protein n=1 Tax=unclassified Rhodococcus (in: high G+C Gram-positive bacteria) TaxID=192944 RepID=UPI0020CBAE52|nr:MULTISPECIES: DUF2797 domain-containing protein [unclassified Rhodococcus (in: high G+C Gram-positive bacteria)]
MRLLDVATEQIEFRELVGRTLGFRAPGASTDRYCTGRMAFRADGPPRYVPCPGRERAVASGQCASCADKDSFRFVHTVHRSGFVSRDLEKHVMQPHWLYLAAFANGTFKIGTAADTRKWGRLAEQGAICARYVAHADDGKVVRVAEDLVTESMGLRQAVRSAAKAASLCLPIDVDRLDAAAAARAEQVREMLTEAGIAGCTPVDERWAPPAGREALSENVSRVAYPADIATGSHGLEIRTCVGQAVIATVDDETYVVDLAALKGRRIELGAFTSDLPAVQSALF